MHEIEIHGVEIVMITPRTNLKAIMSESHTEPLIEITTDLEQGAMKLSAINVTTLDTWPEIAKMGLQVLQVLQRKIGKYQNNRQFGKRSKKTCKLRNVGLL